MNRFIVFGLSAALSASSASHQEPSREFPLSDCLAAYAARDYDGALRPIAGIADLERAYDALAISGSAWIHLEPSDSPHRRLVAASFALEVAGLRKLGKPVANGAIADVIADVYSRVRLSQLLVAWGAAALTSENPILPTYAKVTANGRVAAVKALKINMPVQPAEREWFRAAAVTLEGGGWSTLLDLSQEPEPPSGLTGIVANFSTPPAFPLLPLALARMPNDPLLLLVGANAELERDTFMDPLISHLPMNDYIRSPRSTWSEGALKHYKALASIPEVAGGARLRAGFIEVRLGQRADGRRDLAEADRISKDPQIQYASRLLAGTAWETDHRLDEAERSYRAALEAVPHARSASSLLAALLTNSNRMDEASSVLDGELSEALDPWITFGAGLDERLLPDLISKLRAALQ